VEQRLSDPNPTLTLTLTLTFSEALMWSKGSLSIDIIEQHEDSRSFNSEDIISTLAQAIKELDKSVASFLGKPLS
jgi:hypothetical protein